MSRILLQAMSLVASRALFLLLLEDNSQRLMTDSGHVISLPRAVL